MRKRGGHPGKDRQFCDTGHQYRSAIFYNTEEQQRLALQSRAVDRCRRGTRITTGFPTGFPICNEDHITNICEGAGCPIRQIPVNRNVSLYQCLRRRSGIPLRCKDSGIHLVG
jgi:hypothetical protein